MGTADEVAGWTHRNLRELEDVAPANGLGERWEARAGREPLEAEQTGFTHFWLRPGRRSPFVHRQKQAEEIYVVLEGTGRVWLDGELRDVGPRDVIRVAPETARAFEAGDDGLEYLAFGPHHDNDGQAVESDWPDEEA